MGAISAALSSGTLGFAASVLLQHRSPLEGIGHRGTCTNTSVGASGMQRPLHGLQCSPVVGRKSKKKGSVGCMGKKRCQASSTSAVNRYGSDNAKGLGTSGRFLKKKSQTQFAT